LPMSSSDETDNLRSLGAHRVIEPEGALTQPAWKLDNSPVTLPTETLVYVHTLHIDSASFTQIANACEQDSERMREHILDIVARRGKMHNPTTG
jgi:L-erythro-3,5-diaminohexanoate dehydrogenase